MTKKEWMKAYEDWINANLLYNFEKDPRVTCHMGFYNMKRQRVEIAVKKDDHAYLKVTNMATDGRADVEVVRGVESYDA